MMERPYRLSARFVATIDRPGRYGDGRGSGGLSLLVKHTTRGHLAKSWAQRINVDGRQRNLGLGSWPHISLAEAREKCALNLAARRRGELVTGRKRTVPTFEEALEKVIAVHRAGWKDGSRQEELWRATLRDYAMPKLRGRPVHRINTADVMAVLLPIWNEKRVTARRVRHRISAVMRWAEIDLDAPEWRIPAERMKTKREHRVPLSTGALVVLRRARELADGSGLVFPSARGRPLSEVAMPTMVRNLGIGAVPHGFRSSFRDWAAECTDAPREVCELALAHVNTNAIEAAYRRTDLFDRRRVLMESWGSFLAVTKGRGAPHRASHLLPR